MKILHIEGGAHLYGGSLQVFYLLRELSLKKIDNVLLCPTGSDLSAKSKPYASIYELDMKSDLDFFLIKKIINILKKENPDIVHLHSRKVAEIIGAVAAKTCNVPSILTRRVDNKENKLFIHLKYSLYNKIITISHGIKKVLVNQGLNPKKIVCVKSAVDYDLYSKAVDKEAFKNKLNLNTNSFLIGMIAQFIQRKGHEKLIYAVKNLLSEFKNIHVLLYGQGPLFNSIQNLVCDLKIERNFHFMGFVNDLENHIGGLDLVVHPAEKEGLGVSLLQASSAQVPVVATNVGGIPEVIKNNVNGYLIPNNDPVYIVEAIKKLINNYDLRKSFGKNGIQMVKRQFSLRSMVEGNLEVYKEILN